MKLAVALLAFCFIGIPGCTAPKHHAQNGPTWSLGLGVDGQSLPLPGPFREGSANVTAAATALNVTVAHVLSNCGKASSEPDVKSEVVKGNLLWAIWITIDQCQTGWGARGRDIAASANSTDEKIQLFHSLQRESDATISAQAALLSAIPPSGSVVEIEFQTLLMWRNAWYTEIAATASSSYGNYNRTGNHLDWVSVVTNLRGPIEADKATRDFIASYPWSNGTCDVPDIPALETNLQMRIDSILNRSMVLQPPSEGFPQNEIYGSNLKGALPAYHHYVKYGWWQGLLGLISGANTDDAILDTYSSANLPSKAEALYLLAQHEHSNRTLSGESSMVNLRDQITDGQPWEQAHEAEARWAMALPHVESGFAQLHCTKS